MKNNLPTQSINPEESEALNYDQWKNYFLKIVLRAVFVILAFVVITILTSSVNPQTTDILYIFVIIIIGVAAFAPLSYSMRAFTLLAIFYVVGTNLIVIYGIAGEGSMLFLALIALTTLLYEKKYEFVALGLTTATIFVIAALTLNGQLGSSLPPALYTLLIGTWIDWIIYWLDLMVFAAILIFAIRLLKAKFDRILKEAKASIGELIVIRNELEQRVADRTRDLLIASDVSRQITRVLDLDVLLPQLVEQTRSGFNLHYASVFLYDSETQELLHEAGTGDEGTRMKADAVSFHIDTRPSLIAQAAQERQPVIVRDMQNSGAFPRNSYPPEVASEAVFPMLVSESLIGVLDLQSAEKDFFKEGDVQIFATLAEQIAIAVQNAKLYEQQVHAAEDLRRADQMKTQFLSSMSHELRTPLNAIINLTEVVATGMIGEVATEQKELLMMALQSSQHLLHLINDVLDISKIQAGRLTLYVEDDVNLYQEIESVLNMAMPLFADKPMKLEQDIDDNLPVVLGDKRRLRQILLNLLSNAAKFTEEGVVTLSAKNHGDHVLFAVIDNGKGIAPEAQTAIFEPFVQTLDGMKMAQGTGLGLPISRSLAQAHGGDLWVESKPGKGAAFYFSLPITAKEVA